MCKKFHVLDFWFSFCLNFRWGFLLYFFFYIVSLLLGSLFTRALYLCQFYFRFLCRKSTLWFVFIINIHHLSLNQNKLCFWCFYSYTFYCYRGGRMCMYECICRRMWEPCVCVEQEIKSTNMHACRHAKKRNFWVKLEFESQLKWNSNE